MVPFTYQNCLFLLFIHILFKCLGFFCPESTRIGGGSKYGYIYKHWEMSFSKIRIKDDTNVHPTNCTFFFCRKIYPHNNIVNLRRENDYTVDFTTMRKWGIMGLLWSLQSLLLMCKQLKCQVPTISSYRIFFSFTLDWIWEPFRYKTVLFEIEEISFSFADQLKEV